MGKALWRSSNGSLSIQQSRGTGSQKQEVASPWSGREPLALLRRPTVLAPCAPNVEPRTCGTRLPSSGDHVNESGWFAQGPDDPTALEGRFPTGQGEAAVQPFGGSTRPIP